MDEIGGRAAAAGRGDETTPLGRAWMCHARAARAVRGERRLRGPGASATQRAVVADVLGRLLFQVRPARPAFGEVPADDDLSLPQSTAWDAYLVGRLAAGTPPSASGGCTNRNRHGYSDVADAAWTNPLDQGASPGPTSRRCARRPRRRERRLDL